MKQHTSSLSVSEFVQMLERLCSSTSVELDQTRARMDALRDQPPG